MKRARIILCLRNQLSSLRTISAIRLLRNLGSLSLFEAKRAIESLVEKGGATVLDMTLPENPEKLIQELLDVGVRVVIERELLAPEVPPRDDTALGPSRSISPSYSWLRGSRETSRESMPRTANGSQIFTEDERMLRDQVEDLFRYEHLPEHLQAISKPFSELALKLFDDNVAQTLYIHSAIRDEMIRMLWDVKNRAVWLHVERNKNTGVA